MRKRLLASVMLTLMAGVACEAEHGKGGFVDRAMAKDLRKRAPHHCGKGRSWRASKDAPSYCRDEEEDDSRPECEAACRGPNE